MLFDNSLLKIFVFYIDDYIARDTNEINNLLAFANIHHCIILTENGSLYHGMQNENIEIREWNFSLPNYYFQCEIMRENNVKLESIAYISDHLDFLNNAKGLLSCTVLLSLSKIFEFNREASFIPDLLVPDINSLEMILKERSYGFIGEIAISKIKSPKGRIIVCRNTEMDYLLVSAGRYYGIQHYLSLFSTYSSAIRLNKSSRSKLFGSFNEIFSNIFIAEIKAVMKNKKSCDINLCSVPDKLSKNTGDKFAVVRNEICKTLRIKDITPRFKCIRDYTDQKSVSGYDRAANVKNAFSYDGSLKDKTILLIDDIVTTGATMSECVKVLKEKGAKNVIGISLAINQIACDNIFHHLPFFDLCNNCRILFNSNDLKPFYTSLKSKSFNKAKNNILKEFNKEFLKNNYSNNSHDNEFF